MSSTPAAPGRQVVLRGGSPWGFRMHGGAESPLRISRVNPGSKAADESIREGEVITSINGHSTLGLPNTEAHSLIKAAGDTLALTLSPDPSKRRLHTKTGAATPEQTEKQTEETPGAQESKESATESSLVVQKQLQLQPASPNKSKNQPPANHESTKSSSHRVGGRQKRNRRLRARKLAQQLDNQLQSSDAGLLSEPSWEQVDEEIAPFPAAVHAYPLVYAEAIVVSDVSEQQLDEEIRRLFEIHVATKMKMIKRKAETFPPSLRRLDVIREDEESSHQDHNIYEDVDLRGTQESLLSSDGEMDMGPSDADEATLEFEKIMSLEEQNYEPYHSSSSDVDADFAACDELATAIVRRSRGDIDELMKRSDDYETVLVTSENQVVVQQVQVEECPGGGDFEQICEVEDLEGRNIEAEFEEICRQNEARDSVVQAKVEIAVEEKTLEMRVLKIESSMKVPVTEVEDEFVVVPVIKNVPEAKESVVEGSDGVEDNKFGVEKEGDVKKEELFKDVALKDEVYVISEATQQVDDYETVENKIVDELIAGQNSSGFDSQDKTDTVSREVLNLQDLTEAAKRLSKEESRFSQVLTDFSKSKPLPITTKTQRLDREEAKLMLEISKLNFLKTPLEDEIVSKTEVITLESPRSSGKIPRALAAQLEENLEMLEREICAENEELEDMAVRSAEIIDKFSAKLDEMNDLINESSSPVIMEEINLFAEQLIADDEAANKSLFEANKDKLVSFIREANGMEDARPSKVQDVSNLLRFLEREELPEIGEEEEKTLTSLEAVTQRLAEVLQNSLRNSPQQEADFGLSDSESKCARPASSLSSAAALSRTPLSANRSRSASIDSNASQGTTIYVASTCSSVCSSGWTAGGAPAVPVAPKTSPPSLRVLCVAAVSKLARGREVMLAWGLASAAELKISLPAPNLARRPPPPPPARWYPTGVGPFVVGLSPAQQRAEPQLTRERAALLLDLHCKFAERRAYHEVPCQVVRSADKMGVDQHEQPPDVDGTVDKAKMLADWLEDEVRIDESHTQSVMTTARKFEVERYHISKQRDIAVEIQGQRQFRMLKQQMDELEEERRQQEQLLDGEQQQMAPPVGADSPPPTEKDDDEESTLQQLALLEEFANSTRARMAAAAQEAADGQPTDDFGNNNATTATSKTSTTSYATVPSPNFKAKAPCPGVWSPKTGRAASSNPLTPNSLPSPTSSNNDEPPPPPVWTPKASPTLERKEFRPVKFDASTPPPRPPPYNEQVAPPFDLVPAVSREQASSTISNSLDRKLTLNIPKLPRAQNPTVTLLQKAREGQLPKGASYLERTKMSSNESHQQQETHAHQESAPSVNPNDILYSIKREEEIEENKKLVQLSPIVYDGIGPTTKDGIPIVMRSNIKEENYGKWYKRMYESLHKAGRDDDSITIRYRPSSNSRRGHPHGSAGGYASEPEPLGDYDSDVAGGISSKYATLDRRRIKNKEADFTSTTMPRSRGMAPSIKYACEVYKNQPGRIEDYEPGRSSISEKEAKLQSGMQASAQSKKLHVSSLSHAAESQSTAKKQYMAHALKDGYSSDSQLVFKKRDDSELPSALSPVEQKQVYKTIQSGGEVPLSGLRKLAPEKPKDGIEYFPLTPTLNRIRVHKPRHQVPSLLYFPVRTVPPVFSTFKRTARFAAPMPPLRRSSRHNPTLRLWSAFPIPPNRVTLLREQLACRLAAGKPSRIPVGTTTRSTTVLLTKEPLPVRLSVSVSPKGRQILNTNQTAPVRRVSASAVRHADCVGKKKVALKQAPAPSSLAKPKTKEEPKKGKKKQEEKKKNGNGVKKTCKVGPKLKDIVKERALVAKKEPQQRLSRSSSVLERARKFSHTVRTVRPSPDSSAQLFLTQRRAVSQSPFRVYDSLFHSSTPCLAVVPKERSSSAPPLYEPGNRRPLSPQSRADYIEYLLDLRHKLPPGQRFKELAHLFNSLERIANLQKLTASCSDVRKAVIKQPKLANFERWWCERTLQKAEREMRQLYGDLRLAQRERIFTGKVPACLQSWRPDSGLRCKELSVEDLRNKYLSIASAEGTTELQLAKLEELQTQKDSYKPLWRGSSVQNLAEQFVGEKRRSRSVGAVRSSSLTGQEVAKLKSRLSDILKAPPPSPYEVRVGADKKPKETSMHVRRNSLLTRDQLYSPVVRRREAKRSSSMKADSVAALPTATAATGSSLSESEKRRISMTLSQEILARVGKKKQQPAKVEEKSKATKGKAVPVSRKEDKPAKSRSAEQPAPPPPPPTSEPPAPPAVPQPTRHQQSPSVSPRTCYSLDSTSGKKEEEEEFVLVLAPAGEAASKAVEQWAGGAGGGRASTTSSEASNRTVVSRSCTDLKDFFGERAATPSSMLRARSTSPVVRSLAERFERRRTPSPIPQRKLKDRYISRVNVISKTASLQQKKAGAAPGGGSLQQRRSRSGDVFKLCQQFENASLLGQMFTSTPDVRELNSVAPLYFSKPCLKTNNNNKNNINNNQQQPAKYDPEVHKPKFTYRPADDGQQQQQQQQTTSRPSSRNVTFREPDALQSFFDEFERDKESPHKFVECGDVTIHYRSPVRGLAREAPLSEEELARRQEEAMRRIYQEERRRKYLQELHDIESRRHTDNFTPSQKSPIPLNRYDNFFEDIPSRRDRTPEPKMVARALYNFVGQSSRELTFRRGDIILVRRQIDRNWYEGEHNASVGLFPFNYVEIIPYDGVRTMPKGPSEGKARAKFNFVAQSSLELSLVKGEMVVLTRRVDDNWYEGRIGLRRGIFPCTYVEVINEPGERLDAQKPMSKSSGTYMNGSAPFTGQSYSSSKYAPYMSQTLHIDTRSDPIPYRALYNYKPQNEDELELREGDTVFVMEKCDDGWYVGTSNRTGHFGTFPGNYVERI